MSTGMSWSQRVCPWSTRHFPGSRPIEDVSGFQARPAGKPQARMAAQLDVVKARALSPASRALVMSAAGSRV